MKVVWACVCVCACLAGTAAGEWAWEVEGERMIDMKRQEASLDSSEAPSDTPTTTTTTTTTTTDLFSETTTDASEMTTTTDSSTSEPTTTTTTSTPATTTTTSIPDSNAMTPSLPVVWYTRPMDCADLLMAGFTTSGVYEIYPFTCRCSDPVVVWCDMDTDGGGWTVFLNRQYQWPQLDFNRTWDEYKAGFGLPHEEHWLGLEALHIMTYGRTYSLRLDIRTSGVDEYATRAIMRVDGENEKYRITSSGRESSTSSVRNCFRSMSPNRFYSFSTVDRDHDSYRGNCAVMQGGGWWYGFNCKYFNPTSPYGAAISLTCLSSPPVNVTRLQLKMRPASCDTPVKTIHLQDMSCGCRGTNLT